MSASTSQPYRADRETDSGWRDAVFVCGLGRCSGALCRSHGTHTAGAGRGRAGLQNLKLVCSLTHGRGRLRDHSVPCGPDLMSSADAGPVQV